MNRSRAYNFQIVALRKASLTEAMGWLKLRADSEIIAHRLKAVNCRGDRKLRFDLVKMVSCNQIKG